MVITVLEDPLKFDADSDDGSKDEELLSVGYAVPVTVAGMVIVLPELTVEVMVDVIIFVRGSTVETGKVEAGIVVPLIVDSGIID